jgi:hypothetical protein
VAQGRGRRRRLLMGRRRTSVQTIHEDGTDVLTTCGEGPNRFRVLDDFIMDARETTFFDGDGNEIRTIVHYAFEDRFYNSRTGKEITGTVHNNVELTPQDKESWSAGGHYSSTVPGVGLVFMDTGVLKFDEQGENLILEGGHHPILGDGSDHSEREREMLLNLCEVLADS